MSEYDADHRSRPMCPECGDHTDDNGGCGECFNCGFPCCTHLVEDPDGDGVVCPDACCSYQDPTTGDTCDRERGHDNGFHSRLVNPNYLSLTR